MDHVSSLQFAITIAILMVAIIFNMHLCTSRIIKVIEQLGKEAT